MNRDAIAFLATCSDVSIVAKHKINISTAKCQDDDGESLIDDPLPRLPRQVQRFTAKLKIGGKGKPAFRIIEKLRSMDAESYLLDYVVKGIIPPEPPDVASPPGNDWGAGISALPDSVRDECIARGLWVVIDRIWTKALADWIGSRTVLEIMAGGGWIAKALNDCGITVTATDDFSWSKRHAKMDLVYPVQRFDAVTACKQSGYGILLVSWPPYGDDAICRACEAWGSSRPIIYIGESEGGCNAPDEFFEHFREIDDAPNIPLMSWCGLHDGCFIGYYQTTVEE